MSVDVKASTAGDRRGTEPTQARDEVIVVTSAVEPLPAISLESAGQTWHAGRALRALVSRLSYGWRRFR
ncbi:MAG: hypothetical protein ACRDRW_20100 [Pseudonocardiaceae bacterium]